VFSGIVQILLGVLGLSIVVLVHEGGHYIAARLVGIQVETFSIGFGRRLIGFRKGHTDYRISLVPLGGYCRFFGEQSFRKAIEEKLDHIPGDEGEFYSASALRRIIVSFSGPLANLIFAAIVFTLISWIGYQEYYTEPKIILASEWSEDAKIWPADKAGLESGDYILSVEDKEVQRFNDLRRLLVFRPGENLHITVRRGSRILHKVIAPELDKDSGTAIIGVLNWVDPVIAEVIPDSDASIAGMKSGDRILSVNGVKTPHTVAFHKALESFSGDALNITVERSGKELDIQLPADADINGDFSFLVFSGRSQRMNLFQAFTEGITETWDNLYSTLRGLRMLFMGIKLQNAVSGPVRLISDTGAVVAEGFSNGIGPGLLWSFELMSLISVSLAFINLLPIPVLDGGQILLFTIEIIRRRPLNPKSVYRYQFIGTIIVIIIAVAATTGDMMHFNSR